MDGQVKVPFSADGGYGKMKINKKNSNKKKYGWQLLALLMLIITACDRPVVQISNIPENTPPGSNLYIAGNFNSWDPGDVRFTFELGPDSNYYFTMPRGFGRVEYKVTRGDWTTTETDICGYEIPNRSFNYRSGDTINISVLSWQDLEPLDCPEVTIVVDKLPENTPEAAPIAIAGNFNEWSPDSASYMKKDPATGNYVLTLPRRSKDRLVEFKITRGSLLTAEADRLGNERERRQLRFGMVDTLFVEVENWEDLPSQDQNSLTIILEEIPEETYPGDEIYITGTFNGWYPKENDFRLSKNKAGRYEIKLPKSDNERIEFKFTRGDWSKQEVDRWGYKIPNRVHRFDDEDTLRLRIANWLDRSMEQSIRYSMLIEHLPETTPDNPEIYLAVSTNGWDPGDRDYRFTRLADGNYFLSLDHQTPYFEYKITRGSWATEEANHVGRPIQNRVFRYSGEDTVYISVENWIDLPPHDQNKVVILIDSVPRNTPKNKHIYIAGNFNGWDPGNPGYILSKNLQEQYYITIPKRDTKIEFKFTLGSWNFEELNNQGNPIPNRVYHFGYVDTLKVKVENWRGI